MGTEERFRHRLAWGLGRTVAELEATLGHDEYLRWLVFHGLFDLPDGFLVTGQLGAIVGNALAEKGRKVEPSDFAPYYETPRPARSNLAAAFAFLKTNGKHTS